MADVKTTDRPDLAAWKARAELRRSSAATPVKSGKRYVRKAKHTGKGW